MDTFYYHRLLVTSDEFGYPVKVILFTWSQRPFTLNRNDGVMVSVLASIVISIVIDRGFEPQSGQTKPL